MFPAPDRLECRSWKAPWSVLRPCSASDRRSGHAPGPRLERETRCEGEGERVQVRVRRFPCEYGESRAEYWALRSYTCTRTPTLYSVLGSWAQREEIVPVLVLVPILVFVLVILCLALAGPSLTKGHLRLASCDLRRPGPVDAAPEPLPPLQCLGTCSSMAQLVRTSRRQL